MATHPETLAVLSNEELSAAVARLVALERASTADLIAALAEFDARRIYLPEGFPSLFAYCTGRLHLSEHAAYHRIEAARAARRFPVILTMLEEGVLTLTAVALLRPHLTSENHVELLSSARHQTKRAVEELVARLHSRPDVRASVRRLPNPHTPEASPGAAPSGSAGQQTAGVTSTSPDSSTEGLPDLLERTEPGGRASAPGTDAGPASSARERMIVASARSAIVRASAPSRYQVQLTISGETHAKLRRAQDLLRHAVPNGDLVVVFDRALTLLVEDLERQKFAATKALHVAASSGSATRRPTELRPELPEGSPVAREAPQRLGRSRRIPAAVRRTVWIRDGGRCAFVGTAGRCPERGFLEFHHELPFAAGGDATVENTSLRCRRHNGYEAERFFGEVRMTVTGGGVADRHG